jgi:hypothetical protein
MNKRVSLCLTVALVTVAMAGLPNWVRLAAPGVPDQTVPFARIAEVANRRAVSLWAEARLGDVVPLVDVEGKAIAYTFHYRIDGKEFPDYATAVSEVAAEQQTLAAPGSHSRYGYVLASARYDRAPILCYGEGSTEFFHTLERARDKATGLLGAEPVLTEVYYVWPISFFEFTASGRTRIVEAHPPYRTFTADEFTRHVQAGEREAVRRVADRGDAAELKVRCAEQMRAEWNRCLTDASAFETVAVFVPDYEDAPFYDWSYGCSPTSGTMVVGYVDISRQCGRCIYDFFQRWDCVEGETDYQIPWAQRAVATFFYTDTLSGGTYPNNIGSGLQQFGDSRDYLWTVFDASGAGYNDWAWASDSDEISNGYPMVWSALWEQHSLAAFGIRTPSKDIYVHNTWWRPAAWWHYTDGNSQSYAFVSSIHPDGGSEHNLRLLYPRGDTLYAHNGSGEILWVGRSNAIRWDNDGYPGDSVTIELSTNGGWGWQRLVSGVADSGSYEWDIPRPFPPGEQLRLRLKTFYGGVYAAGDGSQGNFRLATVPFPPTPLSPPSGRPITAAPIVLIVDTIPSVDSFNFLVYHSPDTIYRSWSTVTICSLPTSLFRYGQLYGWRCRAHNSFGWSAYSPSWTFWCRFNPIEEGSDQPGARALEVASLSNAIVPIRFALSEAGPIRVVVHDATGRPVRELLATTLNPGVYELAWDLCDKRSQPVAAGCYFVTLVSGRRREVRKLEVYR